MDPSSLSPQDTVGMATGADMGAPPEQFASLDPNFLMQVVGMFKQAQAADVQQLTTQGDMLFAAAVQAMTGGAGLPPEAMGEAPLPPEGM